MLYSLHRYTFVAIYLPGISNCTVLVQCMQVWFCSFQWGLVLLFSVGIGPFSLLKHFDIHAIKTKIFIFLKNNLNFGNLLFKSTLCYS